MHFTGLTTAQLQYGLPAGFNGSIWKSNPDLNGGEPSLTWQTVPSFLPGSPTLFQSLLQDTENLFSEAGTQLASGLETLSEALMAFPQIAATEDYGLAALGGVKGILGTGASDEVVLEETGTGLTWGKTILNPMQRGKLYQDLALEAKGISENTQRITVLLPGGRLVTVVPDALGQTIVEIKDVVKLYVSDQFRLILPQDYRLNLL